MSQRWKLKEEHLLPFNWSFSKKLQNNNNNKQINNIQINSPLTVPNIFALAIQSATKNDAYSADTFDDVVALNYFFFPLKEIQGLVF